MAWRESEVMVFKQAVSQEESVLSGDPSTLMRGNVPISCTASFVSGVSDVVKVDAVRFNKGRRTSDDARCSCVGVSIANANILGEEHNNALLRIGAMTRGGRRGFWRDWKGVTPFPLASDLGYRRVSGWMAELFTSTCYPIQLAMSDKVRQGVHVNPFAKFRAHSISPSRSI